MQALVWGPKCLLSMLTCMLGSVKGVKRTFGEGYKEHLKAPSAIHHHSSQTGHTTNHNNFQIIGREGHNLARNIKESIYIRVNTGGSHLSRIFWEHENLSGLSIIQLIQLL